MTYTPERLRDMLAEHAKWLANPSGEGRADLAGANLAYANLAYANLFRANLSDANLFRANLSDANLSDANLRGANLSDANLFRANLSDANLSDANLRGANVAGANLAGANLRGANLRGANLMVANLTGAHLPPLAIVPEQGSFTGFKRTAEGVVLTLEIPVDAQRTNSTGRKCRASKARVLAANGPGTEFTSTYDSRFKYRVGDTVEVHDFDPDIRLECTSGIHFFITRKEAEEYYG